jgi:thiosulfate/3-mercaptopyruvate sulfurtransferase
LSTRYPGLIYLKADQLLGRRLLYRRAYDMSGYAKDVLVHADWLQEHLDDETIRIVEVDENPELYAEAHVPGAVGFDWKQDLQDPIRRDFLGPKDFGALFSRNGISSDHTIVLYGDRNNWFAAYTYWYLKYYGHEKVLLLNGPREKWIADGRPTSSKASSHRPATFVAKPGDETIRAHREEVLAAVGDSTNLVDVRSPAEFAGEIISPSGYEQEGAQRAGHIPGAASIPWAQAVNEDGTFKSAEQLSELYGSKGVLDGKDVIAYCRIGERSAHTWFVLHELLGKDRVKNYDGSWTEWGSLVGVPIETGASS